MTEERRPLREYVGIVWIGDGPGVRFSFAAEGPEEARALAIERYGDGHTMTVWNEDDAEQPR